MSTPELDRLLSRLEGVKRCGKRWRAKCPAHEDRTPSLSIVLGSDGRVLLFCFACCPLSNILAALDLRPRDLFVQRRDIHRSRFAGGRRPW